MSYPVLWREAALKWELKRVEEFDRELAALRGQVKQMQEKRRLFILRISDRRYNRHH